ncbi:MAG: Uma2 family endonuclease [Chloroflexaceae bacterium]|jgi:Uma2 family endonuclease|nr:Uma2 family endonuclease [Chloroflexaceae bacterium]
MSLPLAKRYTAAEYLAFERSDPDKHEFVDGDIVLQAGGSRPHALIAANVMSSLHQQLRSRICSVFGSDMRIAIPQARRYVYTGVSVACGEAQFEDAEEDSLTNPTLVIEVLSPLTERYDRGKKFKAYQQLASFQEYLLIAQDSVQIEHFVRQTDNLWTIEVITEPTETLALRSIQCKLTVAEVYEKVLQLPQLDGDA